MARIVQFFALALLISTAAVGQSTTGSISGIVKNGADVPLSGATVVLTNSANNFSRTVTTGSTGLFVAPQLPPGVYVITVEKEEYRKLVRTGVVLTATGQLSAGRFTLEAGAIGESVTQAADEGELEIQAASGERSGLLTNVAIRDLSLNGRSLLDLLGIVPGIVSFADGQVSHTGVGSDTPGLGAIFVNGTRSTQHQLTVDGSSNVFTVTNGGLHVTINPDAVAEVKVLASNYPAEFGRSAGGFIQIVTKSGTLDYHGTARFFHRHEGLNANSYFNNAEGRNPDGSEIRPRPLYRYNYLGYDIGGPVVLGSWNRNKDKLFFYWNQEFYRQLVPGQLGQNIRVPTAAERRGDFSQTVDGNGNRIFIRDPNRAGTCNAVNQTGCFPGNIVPTERFFQDGPAILNLYPLPNFSGENRFNYISSNSSTYPRREDIIRIDYNLAARTRISARYINNSDSQLLPIRPGDSNFPLFPLSQKAPGRNGAMSLFHAFSPTLANEFIFGPSTGWFTSAPMDDKATRRGNNIHFPLLFPKANSADILPNFDYGSIANTQLLPIAILTGLPQRIVDRTYDFSDNMSKVLGLHAIKGGVFIQRNSVDRSGIEPVSSIIDFRNNADNPLNTGHPFANALLGIYDTYQQPNNSPRGLFRYTNLEGYVQDNWKITSRLTLDYGLRLSWYQPQYETQLQGGFFDPDLYDPANAQRLYEPVLAGNQRRTVDPANRPATITVANTQPANFIGLIVPGSGDIANGIGQASQGYPRAGFKSRGAHWGPRFGFAYDFAGVGKSVVRGGFGIFYDRIQVSSAYQGLSNPPTVQRPRLSFGWLQDLTAYGDILAPPNALGFGTEGHVPTVYSYSLGLQHEVGFNTVLDVAYVATLSRHLLQARNLNAIPYGTTFRRDAQDPTLYAGGVVPEVEPNLPEAYRQAGLRFSGRNAKRAEFLRPFPGYGNIMLREFVGSSNYHSLQLALNRRFSRGFQFGASYSWSKTLLTAHNNMEQTNPFDARRYDYRLASFDRQHVFGAGVVYNTPNLSRYLGSHRLAKAVFDDWQITGIIAASTGTPLELGVSIAQIPPQAVSGSYTEGARFYLARTPQPGPNGLQIDPGAFVVPPIGDIGPWPRQYLRGPGTNNQNIAIFKNFPLGENEQRLQLRVEMFNAFNHTQFTAINTRTNLAVPNASGGFDIGGAIFNNYSRAVITNNVRPPGATEPLGRFFGEYVLTSSPRIIQLAAKLYF